MMRGVFGLLSQPSSYHPQTRLCFLSAYLVEDTDFLLALIILLFLYSVS